MNRREFVRQAAGSALLATAAAAGRVQARGRELVRDGRDVISDRLDTIEDRFDRLEHHQKNLVRVGALAFTVSTGIDLFTLL